MISLIVVLVVVGGLLFIVSRLPIDANVKTIINVIAVIALFIYVLEAFGLYNGPHLGLR